MGGSPTPESKVSMSTQSPQPTDTSTVSDPLAVQVSGAGEPRRSVPWFWLAPIPVALAVGIGVGWLLPDGSADGQPEAAPTVTVTATPSPGSASGGPGAAAPSAGSAQALQDLARKDPMDPMGVGSVEAPVTMIVYSDFFCPYCARFADQTLPTLVQDHVQTGELRIEFRDLDIFGDHSQRAALAAYAAGMQNEYLPFHEALFEGGDNPTDEQMSDDGLKAMAASIGLDGERLLQDMESEEARERVQQNQDEAASIGAFSTPSFLINGEPLVGAQPTETFVQAVEKAKAGS